MLKTFRSVKGGLGAEVSVNLPATVNLLTKEWWADHTVLGKTTFFS
jgi:hypothetical protein